MLALRILFVCSRNRRRSPTAETLFKDYPGVAVSSAGLKSDADEVLTPEDLEWAEIIFVMEKRHKAELSRRFMVHLRDKRVVVLGIPDRYAYMDSELIEVLQKKVPPYLR